MNVLGIETSTAVCAVAVVTEEGTLSERSVLETHVHSEKLLTLVQEVCADARMDLEAIDAVGVSIGPGSFTGLRIGLSAAKGLCIALDRPLIAVPTFNAIAAHFLNADRTMEDVTICVDARQGDYYVGRYRRGEAGPEAVFPVAATPLAAVGWWNETNCVLTDALPSVRGIVPESVSVLDVLGHCSAAAVARLSIPLCAAGRVSSVGATEPMYLKDFVVKTPRRST